MFEIKQLLLFDILFLRSKCYEVDSGIIWYFKAYYRNVPSAAFARRPEI
jgi:hypothetical protein